MNKSIDKELLAVSHIVDKEKNYWLDKLSGELEKCNFPYDYPQPAGEESPYSREKVEFVLEGDVYARLMKITGNSDQNLFMILLSGVLGLLNRYSGCRDIIAAVPIYKQKTEGNFLNTVIVVRCPVNPDMTFKQLLMQVKTTAAEAYANLNYPVERLYYHLDLPSDAAVFSLFETAVMLENVHDPVYMENVTPNILFSFNKTPSAVAGTLEYNAHLYKQETVEHMAAHFIHYLSHAVQQPDLTLEHIDLIPETEQKRLVVEFNATAADYPAGKTVVDLFQDQVLQTPLHTAVVYEQDRLTYLDLDQKSNRLAHYLVNRGVKTGDIVALMVEPSVERMTAMLGILKAGAAYLPIDTDNPSDRVAYMVEECKASFVITRSLWIDKTGLGRDTQILDIDNPALFEASDQPPHVSISPQDRLYIIYTSGTTGKPKGVQVTHGNLVNYVSWFSKKNRLTPQDRTVLSSSFAFDLGYTAVYSSLLCGGQLHLLSKESYYHTEKYLAYARENKITYLKITPSFFSLMITHPDFSRETLKDLRLIVLGGEAIRTHDIERLHQSAPHIRVMNHYGPTEAAIGCVAQHIDWDLLPQYIMNPTIGRPISNTCVYILDSRLKPVPVGLPGELTVTGIGLSKGYLDQPLLTAEKFIPNPYTELAPSSFREFTSHLYKTGDLARWMPDGTIQFLGRIDKQIKIRGYRVEPAEIENTLLKIEGIKEAVVIPSEDGRGGKTLCAYLVPSDPIGVDNPSMSYIDNSQKLLEVQEPFHEKVLGGQKSIGELKERLLETLPEYMVPTYFVWIDAVPLTQNNKIDKRRLPVPEDSVQAETGREYTAPRNPVEKQVADIWQEVLGRERIGVTENFFELGGHSIMMIQTMSRMRNQLQVDIGMKDFFLSPTIEQLSLFIQKSAATPENPGDWVIPRKTTKEMYEASPIQYPEWFLQKMNPTGIFYNQGYIFEFIGELDIDCFTRSMKYLSQRHDILRASFKEIEGRPYLELHDDVELFGEHDIFDIRRSPDKEKELYNIIKRYYNQVIRFDTPPLYVMKMIRLEDRRCVFVLETHHIVWDQVSSFNLFTDFQNCYNALAEGRPIELQPLEINYIDYTEWLNNLCSSGRLETMRQYWLKKFAALPEPLNLPYDYARPPIQTFKGKRIFHDLAPETQGGVEDFCKKNNTTNQIFLLSVLNLLIYRLTGQDDFVVGTPTANRDYKVLEDLIGLFAAALPIRSAIQPGFTFQQLLENVQQASVEAYDNHLYPFNRVIEELKVDLDFSRSKVMSVFYGVQNDETELFQLKLKDLEVNDFIMDLENYTTAFDFTLQVNYSDRYMRFSLRYATDLFKDTTARKFLDRFVHLLEQCIENPAKPIGRFDLLDSDDQKLMEKQAAGIERVDVPAQPIYRRIEENALRFPQDTAIVYAGENCSYRDLNQRANRLAHYLVEAGLKPQDRAAVLLPPSVDLIAALLAILKTGASYVPLHTDYPADRVKTITQQAKTRFIISDRRYLSAHPAVFQPLIDDFDSQLIFLDRDSGKISACDPENLAIEAAPNDIAYVIFTSGTSGEPKGIEIYHRGLSNVVQSTQSYYGADRTDSILFHTPIIFDASILDIFWPLAAGARIVVLEEENLKNITAIGKYIANFNINYLQFVPLVLDAFITARADRSIPDLPSLKTVIVGAAILARTLMERFYRHFPCRLVNHYGPTEITVDAARFDCSEALDKNVAWSGDAVPIGRPITNSAIYVLDRYMNPCPIGVPGELYISSVGNARGYLNRPDLTAAAFVSNPFNDGLDDRLYRTGDKGVLLPDGNLCVLGRLDNQVKVNGNRVELDEIETRLLSCNDLNNASVSVHRDPQGYEKLVAFVSLETSVNTISDENGNAFRLYTISQDPSLKKEFDALHLDAWPKYFSGSPILKNYWNQIYKIFPGFQFALVDNVGQVAGIGNSIPIYWDGQPGSLPAGWDATIEKGFKDFENNVTPNTLVIVSGVIAPRLKRSGASNLLIDCFRALSRNAGFHHFIVILRPVFKTQHQELSIDDYCQLIDENNLVRDKWIQLHLKKGGVIIKTEPHSQFVSGTVEEWKKWENRTVDVGEKVYFDDTLDAVTFDPASGKGDYYDPGVWVDHTGGTSAFNLKYIDETDIKDYVRKHLPIYMVPNRIIVLDRLPQLESGKNDKAKLRELEWEFMDNEKVPPRGEIQEELARVFSEILNRSDIGIYDKFFELGGHSITALLLLVKIEQRFDVKVSVVELFKNPTIADLERYIKKSRSLPGGADPVVRLAGGSGPNVLCIPSITTSPFEFVELSEVLKANGFNVYALNLALFDNFAIEPATVDSFIEECVERIVESGIEGPTVAVGYSIGARLGFEITRRLEARGLPIARYLVLDASPRLKPGKTLLEPAAITDAMIKEHPDYFLLDRLTRSQQNELLSRIKKYLALDNTLITSGKLDAPITVIHSEIQMGILFRDWRKFSNSPVSIIKGFGDHYELIGEKFAARNFSLLESGEPENQDEVDYNDHQDFFDIVHSMLRYEPRLVPWFYPFPGIEGRYIIAAFFTETFGRYDGLEIGIIQRDRMSYHWLPGALAGGLGFVEPGDYPVHINSLDEPQAHFLHFRKKPSGLIELVSASDKPGLEPDRYVHLDCNYPHRSFIPELQHIIISWLSWYAQGFQTGVLKPADFCSDSRFLSILESCSTLDSRISSTADRIRVLLD